MDITTMILTTIASTVVGIITNSFNNMIKTKIDKNFLTFLEQAADIAVKSAEQQFTNNKPARSSQTKAITAVSFLSSMVENSGFKNIHIKTQKANTNYLNDIIEAAVLKNQSEFRSLK